MGSSYSSTGFFLLRTLYRTQVFHVDHLSTSAWKTRVSSLNSSLKGSRCQFAKCFKNMPTNEIVTKIMLNDKFPQLIALFFHIAIWALWKWILYCTCICSKLLLYVSIYNILSRLLPFDCMVVSLCYLQSILYCNCICCILLLYQYSSWEARVCHFSRHTRIGLGGTHCAAWMRLYVRPLTIFFFF